MAESVFGPEGVLLASVFLIPQRAFMWTLGVSYFTKGGGHGWKKVLTNPCILAVLAGTALWAAQVDLPPVLDGAVRSLGSCNTGLSMLLIGMLMSGFHWRDLADPGILCFCGVRLVLIPFLTLAGCRIFHAEALASQVSLLLTAMPAKIVKFLYYTFHEFPNFLLFPTKRPCRICIKKQRPQPFAHLKGPRRTTGGW